ncbi:unnamed protein product [Ascophyllum nodosum]
MMAVEEEPSYESATRDVLLTSAKLIGSSCVDANLAFSKCKAQDSAPEACLKLGGEVLACTNAVLGKIATKCPEEFEKYRKCMDKKQMKYRLCRKEEKYFHDCFYAES